jgi:peptidoglycan/LPS O-acetylase OafA/YrhL
MRFDDELWDHVWERNLTHVERHTLAMALVRRQPPDTTFDRLVAAELARRWRRHALWLVTLYGLWSVFWGGIALTAPPAGAEPTALPAWCVVVGVLAIAACVLARRHLAGYLRAHGAVPRGLVGQAVAAEETGWTGPASWPTESGDRT